MNKHQTIAIYKNIQVIVIKSLNAKCSNVHVTLRYVENL